jgi:hypothetical protein
VGDPDHSLLPKGVLADKCNNEGAEMMVRKSDGPYYRRNEVTLVEGRALGKTNLGGETL